MGAKKEYYTLSETAEALDLDFETIRQALICGEINAGIILDHCDGRWCWMSEDEKSIFNWSIAYSSASDLSDEQLINIEIGSQDIISGYCWLPHRTILRIFGGDGKPIHVKELVPFQRKYARTSSSGACEALIFELRESPRPIGKDDLLMTANELSILQRNSTLPGGAVNSANYERNLIDIKLLVAAFYYVYKGSPFIRNSAIQGKIYNAVAKASSIKPPAIRGFYEKIREAAGLLGIQK